MHVHFNIISLSFTIICITLVYYTSISLNNMLYTIRKAFKWTMVRLDLGSSQVCLHFSNPTGFGRTTLNILFLYLVLRKFAIKLEYVKTDSSSPLFFIIMVIYVGKEISLEPTKARFMVLLLLVAIY